MAVVRAGCNDSTRLLPRDRNGFFRSTHYRTHGCACRGHSVAVYCVGAYISLSTGISERAAAMPSVSRMPPVTHPSLPGVRIFSTGEPLLAGSPQTVLVEVEPNGSIPLHTHDVDAVMLIVAGSGWVCSTDGTNGHSVNPGVRVFYEAERPHGFRAGQEGLSFISINGGIVDKHAERWDMDLKAPTA
jgi:quercetin dioxygenase-like cupin family protein